MSSQGLIGARYEVRDIVGRGGMGVVYRCFDRVVGREVALKTLGDIQGRAALDMFYKEWRLLANLHHPNIIEIFDIGDFEDAGVAKPYFVMPLLPGSTLETLLRAGGQGLPIDRLIDVIAQTCRGLQAIHDNGLVHRDIKPSNIFVLDLNAVKLIDFGIAHLAGAGTGTGLKGTVSYMSPEQVRAEECTAASDIFSLGVVCYEALSGTKPFRGSKSEQVFEAILNHNPQPVSELNPAVNQTISRAVHKALAKQPRHRYASAAEFGETLQRAMRGDTIPALDPSWIQPRIQRAIRAFEQTKYDMASDILADLEAAGHMDPALTALRGQIEQASRKKRLQDLLDRARLALEEDELSLALQNTEAALAAAPDSEEAAQLRDRIQAELYGREVQESLATAEAAMTQYAFSRARHLLTRILELEPNHPEASAALQRLESREQAYRVLRQQKEELYSAAREAWANSEFATASEKLRRVLSLESRAPDTSSPDSRANCSNFLNLAESAQTAMDVLKAHAMSRVATGEYDFAVEMCSEVAAKYPGHLLPQGLRHMAEASQKRELFAKMAEAARAAAAEPILERRLEAIRRGSEAYPNQPLFEQWARAVREQLAVANSAAAKARAHEQHGRFMESLEHWQTVHTIYPDFPGLEEEVQRVAGRAGADAEAIFRASEPEAVAPAMRASAASAAAPSPELLAASVAPPPPAPPPSVEVIAGFMIEKGPPAPVVSPPVEPAPEPEPIQTAPPAPPKPTLQERLAPVMAAAAGYWRSAQQQWRQWATNAKLLHSPLNRRLVAVGAICIVIIVAGAVYASIRSAQRDTRTRTGPVAPTTSKARVVIKTGSPGGLIRLNDIEGSTDHFDVEVTPGMYTLEVLADGYAPFKEVIDVPAAGLQRAIPATQPLPASIRLITDLQKGTVRLDDRPPFLLSDSEFSLDDVTPGKHLLVVSAGSSEARVEFTTGDAEVPRLEGPVRATGLLAVAAGSLGRSLQIASSEQAAVVVDSRQADEMAGPTALFKSLARGPHEVLVAPGTNERRIAIDSSHRPTLWFAVHSDRNVGSLVVTAGLESFTVLLDGVQKKRRIRDGSMTIPNLAPKTYKIAVIADGYDASEERMVEVKKGSQVGQTFALNRTVQFARVALQGIPQGAQVLVDGAAVGTVGADGSFSLDKVEPGEHAIEVRLGPQFRATPVKRVFAAREAATLHRSDFHVERVPATIALNSPVPNARLEWSCGGGASQSRTLPATLSCDEGQMSVKVSAAGYADEAKTYTLTAGMRETYTIDLKRLEAAPAEKRSCSNNDLPRLGWTAQQDGWFSSGKGASLPCANLTGIYQFTIATPKGIFGGKSTGWTIASSGRTEFVLDKNSLTMKGQPKKPVDKYMGDGHITFQLTIDSERINVLVRSGNSWEPVTAASGDFRKARIEFPKDTKLSNFAFKER